jgi:hypothetical protein
MPVGRLRHLRPQYLDTPMNSTGTPVVGTPVKSPRVVPRAVQRTLTMSPWATVTRGLEMRRSATEIAFGTKVPSGSGMVKEMKASQRMGALLRWSLRQPICWTYRESRNTLPVSVSEHRLICARGYRPGLALFTSRVPPARKEGRFGPGHTTT